MNLIVMRWLPDGRSEWLPAAGRVEPGLPPVSDDLQLTVLVPAEDVLLLDVARMARSSQQLDQAVPFAIEDQLAAPVEQQHVAWAPANAPGRLRVAVASHERMAAWLTPLRAAGLEADALLPDALALPATDLPRALWDGERALLRLDDARGLAIECDTLALLLSTDKLAAIAWYEIKDLPPQESVIGDINNRNLGVAYVDHSPKSAEKALAFCIKLI